jgi:phosphohistidine phosphatase SixA
MGDADSIVTEICEKYTVGKLLLVGHEPSLGRLIGLLTAANPEININLKSGGVCCLSYDDLHVRRSAILEWLLTPKILSALS